MGMKQTNRLELNLYCKYFSAAIRVEDAEDITEAVLSTVVSPRLANWVLTVLAVP